MLLKFKNQHIFFALESVWHELNYKFRYLVNSLVTENSDDNYVQDIDVPATELLKIFRAVSSQPEGVAAFINHDMQESLIPQLQAVANMADVLKKGADPNEAAVILFAIEELDKSNKAMKENKIINGKTQILA